MKNLVFKSAIGISLLLGSVQFVSAGEAEWRACVDGVAGQASYVYRIGNDDVMSSATGEAGRILANSAVYDLDSVKGAMDSVHDSLSRHYELSSDSINKVVQPIVSSCIWSLRL